MSESGLASADVSAEGKRRPASQQAIAALSALTPALIATAAFFLLWPTASSLISEWRDEANTTTYTHGFLIAGVCLWLLYRSGREATEVRTSPSVLAWSGLIVSALLWLVAVRAGIQTIHQMLLPVIVWLAISSALGLRAAWVCSFAVGYLYFAIPLWGHINEALQYGTVIVVEWLLRLTGVTAFVEDTFVHIPSGIIEIADGCSGLHYFIVGVAIAALYGEIHRDPLKLRLLQISLGVVFAIATNWIRVYIIIVAGYVTDMQHYLVSESHYTFGWFVFAGAMLVFFFVVKRIEPSESTRSSEAERARALVGAKSEASSLGLGLALACSGLALGPVLNLTTGGSRAGAVEDSELLPIDPTPWRGPVRSTGSDWKPVFVGADASAQGTYTALGETVELYVAAYDSQAQKKELIGYANSVLGETEYRVVSQTSIEPRGPANELVFQTRSGQTYVLWYFYRVGSLQTHRGIVAQTWYGVSSLVGAPRSSVVAIRSACRDECDGARLALQRFLDAAHLSSLKDPRS